MSDDAEDRDVDLSVTGNGSLLGGLEQEVTEQVAGSRKVLPVGKIRRLKCRYRPLEDDEVKRLQQTAKKQAKLRRKVGESVDEIEEQNVGYALLLSAACVELLVVDDEGDDVPLHEALARPDEMGERAPTGPLRYNRTTLELISQERAGKLRERLGRDPSAADVARELHRWGKGESFSPLRSNGKLVELWSGAMNAEALGDVLEGS